MSRVDVTVSRTIARPPDVVAAFMSDPANDTRWIAGLREARVLDAGEEAAPIAVGTQVLRTASFLGRRMEYLYEVDAFDEHQLAMRAVKAPFPMQTTYRWEADGESTVATIDNSGDVRGAFALMRRLLVRSLRRNVGRDLERLRGILEAEAPA